MVSPILEIHASYALEVGASNTTQYSLSPSKKIGEGNLTFVATVASSDMLICDGSNTTSANS